MPFNFLNLDKDIRELMLLEVEYDIKNNSLYYSKSFSSIGHDNYVDLLKEAIQNGSEDSLGKSLSMSGFFNETGIRNTEKGPIEVKIPVTAPITFSEGEFNRFYMRAVCLKAIAEKKEVEVYRAKEVSNARTESQMKIGQKMNAETLLEDLRKNIGVDTSLGLPPGPNSGLSIKIIG
jgi:hypothetical protein